MLQVVENNPARTTAPNLTAQCFPDEATLQELFEAQVAQGGQRRALICDHESFWKVSALDFRALNEKANQVAHRLRGEGVKPGQIVGILMERGFSLLVGIWGVLKAGGAYLPLSSEDPVERIGYVLADAQARLLLVHGATVAKAPPGVPTINLEQSEIYAGPADNPVRVNRPEDLAYVIYTSGSTGRPKGVMIEHRSVVNRLDWMQRAYPIGEGDVLLQKTPCVFDVSVWELLWGGLQGAALCLLRPRGERNPNALIETTREHRVSMLHFVPSMLNVFLEYLAGHPEKIASLASVRRVFASGETLTSSHVRKFNGLWGAANGCRLTNLYGPTEATVDATAFDCPAGAEIERVPIGRPIQNMRAYVIRDERPVPAGETGELCLAGVGLARGYLNNLELTGERFGACAALPGERIYRTGDLARWLPDGQLEYLGREDHQVKIRGVRIELGEIENTLRGLPGIADCVVATKVCSESVVLLVAYFVAQQRLDPAVLKQQARRLLPESMVPSLFVEIPAIPLTATGKADRKALPDPPMASPARVA